MGNGFKIRNLPIACVWYLLLRFIHTFSKGIFCARGLVSAERVFHGEQKKFYLPYFRFVNSNLQVHMLWGNDSGKFLAENFQRFPE